MTWHKTYKSIAKHVFRIETPGGSGTGFLFAFNSDKSLAAVATALHVIDQAHRWRQPIRLIQHDTSAEAFLEYGDRGMLIDYRRDSAAIIITSDLFELPKNLLPILEKDKFKKVGVPLGWVGYPALAPSELCFFQGCISAFVEHDDSYLIDGVAINGVSGGPVFAEIGESEPELVGIISAYLSNRQVSGTLPGLLKAHDVTHLYKTIDAIKSLDDARAKEEAAAQEREPSVEPEPPPAA